MTTEVRTPETELELAWRRQRWKQIADAHATDRERQAHLARIWAERGSRWVELAQLRQDLAKTGDLETFKSAMEEWSRRPSTGGFHGLQGQMFLNQLVNAADDRTVVAQLLTDVFTAPTNEDEAAAKLQRLLDYVEAVKQGAHPAPKRVPFLCSYMWASQNHAAWPCIWPSAEKQLVRLGWLETGAHHAENYLNFRRLVLLLGEAEDVENALHWLEEHPVGLDPTLVSRCEAAAQWNQRTTDHASYETPELHDAAERNAKIRLAALRLLADPLTDRVAAALGRSVKVVVPQLTWNDTALVRPDAWVGWRITDEKLTIRVWVDRTGVGVVLHPGHYREGWYRQAIEALEGIVPSDMQLFGLGGTGDGLFPTDRPTDEFVVGRWFGGDAAFDRLDLAEDIVAITAALQPVVDQLVHVAKGGDVTAPPPDVEDDPLRPLVEEDFFEGYRPESAAGGQLTYRLTAGPLARLAERAEERPGLEHVLVIDEINRANLPKVLGELLYLLEYRGRSVHTTYRPDAPFQLPKNLLVIGTMNTADRSIALIDAALRRRFHFVPFFPDKGAIAELLPRWLEHHNEPAWVGELVEMVNANLVRDLGGPHLQIGPSHFMKRGLGEDMLRRIWDYNILPFIEDQFFGQPDRIRRYELDRVLADYRRQTGGSDTTEPAPGADDEGSSQPDVAGA